MEEVELHPLVDLAARLLVKGTGEPWAYPEGAEARLLEALTAAKDSPDIADGVISLFHAAIALSEEEGSPAAAAVVFRALHAARPVLKFGDEQAAALGRQLEGGLNRAIKRAPQVNEAAPPGTVKPSSFPPPRKFRG